MRHNYFPTIFRFKILLVLFLIISGCTQGVDPAPNKPLAGPKQQSVPIVIADKFKSKRFGCLKNPLTKEDLRQIKPELADAYKRARATDHDCVLATVLDRNYELPKIAPGEKFVRMLIVLKLKIDPDDYEFAIPGREDVETREVGLVIGEGFWFAEDGTVYNDSEKFPKECFTFQEYYVEDRFPEVTFHFGGDPILRIKLR